MYDIIFHIALKKDERLLFHFVSPIIWIDLFVSQTWRVTCFKGINACGGDQSYLKETLERIVSITISLKIYFIPYYQICHLHKMIDTFQDVCEMVPKRDFEKRINYDLRVFQNENPTIYVIKNWLIFLFLSWCP